MGFAGSGDGTAKASFAWAAAWSPSAGLALLVLVQTHLLP